MQTDDRQPARSRYLRRVQELYDERQATIAGLASAMGTPWRNVDRSTVRAAVRGERAGQPVPLPTQETVEGLDKELDAHGELIDLWRLASVEQHALEIGLRVPVISEAPTGPTADRGATVVASSGEVMDTNRRSALRGGVMLGSAAAAASVYERIAGADPRPAALEKFEAEIHEVAQIYRTTPHHVLIARLEPKWRQIEALLDTRVTLAVRARLTNLAGWAAFYLGTLGFDIGADDAAREFLALASRHATESGDALLSGSAAAIRSSVAYFTGAYTAAADIAHRAQDGAHPFALPILAGCEARAAALAGRPHDARRALHVMQDNVWSGGLMPGPNPGDEAFACGFAAVTLANLGDGEAAERHARQGLELELANGPDHVVQVSGKYNSLARAYLRRQSPDPEQAAEAVRTALLTLQGRPNRTVIQQAGTMWKEMDSRWSELSDVRDLGELVTTSRRALPQASPTT
ncbi:XRE family transcriptional regulator [Parafrankia discariae]|uniref:XRE family transcriptional regulator n=1 Tax=Parafrankia discariae TaxID=365528 RepID=UPI00039E90A9|nr:XRE family transcriptional regulator [Parafrankia discariae]